MEILYSFAGLLVCPAVKKPPIWPVLRPQGHVSLTAMIGDGAHSDPQMPETLHDPVSPLGLPVEPLAPIPEPQCGVPRLSDSQRLFLIRLARSTVEEAVRQQPETGPKPEELEGHLLEKRACFVTLEKEASLRGCVGHLFPQIPLYAAVIDAARQAALADPRFSSVRPEELGEITLGISVLSSITPLASQPAKELLAQLQPFRHGVVLQFEYRTATFLPQVWEEIPDPSEFLTRLALKGGWEPTAWRDARARLSVYEVESIQEIHPHH